MRLLKHFSLCLVMLLSFGVFFVVSPASAGDYVIGEGDGLIVDVWGVKELNVTVTVRPDGKITVPGIGDVSASGHTPTELQGILATKLKELVKNPIVTVTVKDITNSKVYIFGGGVKAGVADLNRRATLLQLLCTLSDVKVADLRNAYILRKGQKIKTDFYKLFISGDTSDDIPLETNDSLFIPLLSDKNVYVMGAVTTPRFIEYREGMTVMESILEAGGFNKFAKENDTVIIRKEGDKDVTIPVRAKDLVKDGDLRQNIKLKPGDYVIVKEGMF